MKEVQFCICFYQCGLKVPVAEKSRLPISLLDICRKFIGEIKDRAFIRNCMCVSNGSFKTRLGNQNATSIGIEWMPKNIKKKIPFPYKTDAKWITWLLLKKPGNISRIILRKIFRLCRSRSIAWLVPFISVGSSKHLQAILHINFFFPSGFNMLHCCCGKQNNPWLI